MDFEILCEEETTEKLVSIVVVGAGGGGCNAVNGMVEHGIRGVKFVAVNTDVQSLKNSKADVKLQIGSELTGGRGAGGVPEVGETAAVEDSDQIAKVLAGADMVFITAGMGGGTGTGSAPIIAGIAKNQGALTVGVVTKPFDYEKNYRMGIAEAGIAKLREAVDSLIVIPNQRLLNNVDRKTSIPEAFAKANDILRQGVQGISDAIIEEGLINRDFNDVISVMKDQGDALMAIGYGAGENRIEEAVSDILDNPLREDISIKEATRALVIVTFSVELPLIEYDEIIQRITADMDKDSRIYSGMYLDPTLGDKIKVTIVAAGFNAGKRAEEPETITVQEDDRLSGSEYAEIIGRVPGRDTLPPRRQFEDFTYDNNDLEIPTVMRDGRLFGFREEVAARAQAGR